MPICGYTCPFARPVSTALASSRSLSRADVGEPAYYGWRSRSGCTFCFFQQKIEWVRLAENHPDRFAEAVDYEKTALKDGSPFTWSQGESLSELLEPARVDQIKTDYEKRRETLAPQQARQPAVGPHS